MANLEHRLSLNIDEFLNSINRAKRELDKQDFKAQMDFTVDEKKLGEPFAIIRRYVDETQKKFTEYQKFIDTNGLLTTKKFDVKIDPDNNVERKLKEITNEVFNYKKAIKEVLKDVELDFNSLDSKTKNDVSRIKEYQNLLRNIKATAISKGAYKESDSEIKSIDALVGKFDARANTATFQNIKGAVQQSKLEFKDSDEALRGFINDYKTLRGNLSDSSKEFISVNKEIKKLQDELTKRGTTTDAKDAFGSNIKAMINSYRAGVTNASDFLKFAEEQKKLIGTTATDGTKITLNLSTQKALNDAIKASNSELLKRNQILTEQEIHDLNQAKSLLTYAKNDEFRLEVLKKIEMEYDKIITRLMIEKKETGAVIEARQKYIDSYKKLDFSSSFNSILNLYNNLNSVEKKSYESIFKTINELKSLQKQYESTSNEFKKIQTEINKFDNKLSNIKNKDVFNKEFANIVDDFKRAKISATDYYNTLLSFRNLNDKKGSPVILTPENEKTLKRQIELVDNIIKRQEKQKYETEILRGKIFEYTNEIKSSTKGTYEYSEAVRKLNEILNIEIDKYKQIIAHKEAFNINADIERKSLADLINQRNRYSNSQITITSQAKKELEQMQKNYDIVSKTNALTQGVLGSGDRRATLMDKFSNSLVYTISSATYGYAQQSIANLVKVNAEYETGLINITRVMNNLSESEMPKLGKASIDLAKKYGININETQKAMADLAKAGINDPSTLRKMTESVLIGVNTTEIKDSAEMVKYLVSTIKQLGLQFSDSNRIIDEWNALADRYAVSSRDFAEAISKAGASSKRLGLDLEDINAMVVLLGERTATSGNEIGNALKTLESYAYRPETIKALEKYGITIKKNETEFYGFKDIISQVSQKLKQFGDESQASNDILDKLGGAWRKNWISLLADSWSELGKITAEAKEIGANSADPATSYSIIENAKIMETYSKKVEILKNSFSELAISIGQSGLLDQLKTFVEILTTVTNILGQIPSPMKSVMTYAIELGIAIQGVNLILKTFGISTLSNIFTSMAFNIQNATSAMFRHKAVMFGVSEAQKYLDLQLQSKVITEIEYQAVLAKTQGILTNNIALKRVDMATDRERIALNEAVVVGQLASNRSSALGTFASKAGVIGAIAVAIYGVIEAFSFFNEKQKEVDSELEKSLNTYKTYSNSLDDLTQSFYNNKLVIQDSSVTKMEMTNIEKQLQQQLGVTTETIDFQNKSLKDQLDLIEQVKKAKEQSFIEDASKGIKDAKETYNKKDVVSVGSVLTNKDDSTNIQDAVISGITRDMERYTGKKADTFYDSISKVEKVREILKDIDNVKVDQFSGISFLGNKEQQLTAFSETVKSLTLAYDSMNEKQKESFSWLSQLISDSSSKLNDFKTSYKSVIDVVKNYEKALINLAEVSKGEDFRNKYKVQFDYVEQRLKKMQGMKPYELKIEYENLISYKEEWMNLLVTNGDGGKYFDLMNNFFNQIMSGAKKATDGMQYFNEQNDIVTRSVESFIKEEKDLANAYKELDDTGHISGQTISQLIELYPQLSDKVKEQGQFLTIEKKSLEEVFKADKGKTLATIQNRIDEVENERNTLLERLDLREMDIESLSELEQARRESAKDNRRLAKEYLQSDNPVIRSVGEQLNAEAEVAEKTTDLLARTLRLQQLKAQAALIGNESLEQYVKGLKGLNDDDPNRAGKSLPNKLLSDARYQDFNSRLENINALLAEQKSIFDSLDPTDYLKRIEVINKENELLEQKKQILTEIREEQQREKDELRNVLENDKKFTFDSEGVITNGTEILDLYLKNVNDRRGASEEEYNMANDLYNETKKQFERYSDLIKSIPNLRSEFYGVQSEINKNIKQITSNKILDKFTEFESSKKVFERSLKDIDYQIKLANTDKAKQYELLAEKSNLYQIEIDKETTLLKELNQVTDDNILASDEFKNKKLELIDAIKEKISNLTDLRNTEIANAETAMQDAEDRVIQIIDKGLELRKRALDKELDMFNEFIDDKIKAMDRENEANDYQKDMQKELKERQKLQTKINSYALDTSLEGFQKKKELEEKLAELDEKINDKKTNRNRDVIKQGLQDQKEGKQKEHDTALSILDDEFSESKKKLLAHEILIDQSFDKIRKKFPELFNELDVSTTDFFGTFESYELKFGTIVGKFATNFKETVLPDLLLAVETLRKIQDGINDINYAGVEFNKDFDYSSEINALKAKGYKDDSPEIVRLEKLRAAKIYSDPELTALYEKYIPEKYRQNKTTTSINQSNSELDKVNKDQLKPSKYTKKQYERMYFDSSIDYSQEILNLLNKGYAEDSPEVVAMYEKKAAKIYSNDNWRRLYENTLPYQYRLSGSYASGINAGLVNKTGNYLLHGSSTNPEWVLTNSQMYNLVRSLSNNMTSLQSNNGSNMGDINLSINIHGNATNDVVGQIKSASVQVIHDIRRELNKSGIYK